MARRMKYRNKKRRGSAGRRRRRSMKINPRKRLAQRRNRLVGDRL